MNLLEGSIASFCLNNCIAYVRANFIRQILFRSSKVCADTMRRTVRFIEADGPRSFKFLGQKLDVFRALKSERRIVHLWWTDGPLVNKNFSQNQCWFWLRRKVERRTVRLPANLCSQIELGLNSGQFDFDFCEADNPQ